MNFALFHKVILYLMIINPSLKLSDVPQELPQYYHCLLLDVAIEMELVNNKPWSGWENCVFRFKVDYIRNAYISIGWCPPVEWADCLPPRGACVAQRDFYEARGTYLELSIASPETEKWFLIKKLKEDCNISYNFWINACWAKDLKCPIGMRRQCLAKCFNIKNAQ